MIRNTYTLVFIILFLGYELKAQSAKNILRSLQKVEEDIYVGAYEVTNADYRSFLHAARSWGWDVEPYRIDTALWQTFSTEDHPISGEYHIAAAYGEYPVANISHAGALAYCRFLTESYHKDPNRKFDKVKFRLPTSEEWDSFADIYIIYSREMISRASPYGYGNLKYPDLDAAKDGVYDYDIDGSYFPTRVGRYKDNFDGLHDIIGNVSEMTQEPGFVMGGSWDTSIEILLESHSEQIDSPDPRVGFRVVMEVLE